MLLYFGISVALSAPQPAVSPSPDQRSTWEYTFFANPTGGAHYYSNTDSTTLVVLAGGVAGIHYRNNSDLLPIWSGESRVAGDLGLSGGEGYSLRLGTFIGPRWSNVALRSGPDLFYDAWYLTYTQLDPSLGLEWPLLLHLWGENTRLSTGLSPAWLSNPSRRVDWRAASLPGFGHEFSYLIRVGVGLFGLHGSLGYTYRITCAGGQHTLSSGLDF